VEFQINPEYHDGEEPEDELVRLEWETLDTIWTALRHRAAKITIAAMRLDAQESGADFPSDEEMFAKLDEAFPEDGPFDYEALAPTGPEIAEAGEHLYTAWTQLVSAAAQEALEGFQQVGEMRAEIEAITAEPETFEAGMLRLLEGDFE